MNTLWFITFIVSVLSIAGAFVWVALKLGKGGSHGSRSRDDIVEEASASAQSVFNKEFREELKNRGRLHFEKIINENAMFLQQDLRLTTSQLNDFMKDEVKKVLKEEFATYEESIATAKEQAVEAIEKTQGAIDEQRQILQEQLQKQVAEEKAQAVARFEANMGEILNHYILEAIGTEIDLTDQLDYIFNQLEENKQAMVEDIKDGA